MTDEELRASIAELHGDISQGITDLGVPSDFYLELIKEDDWSFLIKLQALLEGVVNSYLANVICNPQVSEVIESALGYDRRVQMIVAASRISKQEGALLSHLGRLRNEVVHNPAHIAFSFESDDGALRTRVSHCVDAAIGFLESFHPEAERGESAPFVRFARRDPKRALWMVVALPLRRWARTCGATATASL